MTTASRPGSTVEAREVLVVGGGIAGIEALMALADLGDNRLRLHLVADRTSFGLPPQSLGVPWGSPLLELGLEQLCRAFGARFTLGRVTGVDTGAREAFTADGGTLAYDELLLTPGATPGFAYDATTTLGFGALPEALASEAGGSVEVLVPAGASWTLPAYQLALLAAGNGRDVRVLTAEEAPLEAFGTGTRAMVGELLERHGVAVETERAESRPSLADTVVALPLLAGPALAGLARDAHGFLRVDARSSVLGCEHVRAAGDATDHPIKQGGLAAQQADIAALEVVRACGGTVAPLAYAPTLRGKLTAHDGEELYLRRALNGLDTGRASRDPLWQPPDAICAWRLARWLAYHRTELELSRAA